MACSPPTATSTVTITPLLPRWLSNEISAAPFRPATVDADPRPASTPANAAASAAFWARLRCVSLVATAEIAKAMVAISTIAIRISAVACPRSRDGGGRGDGRARASTSFVLGVLGVLGVSGTEWPPPVPRLKVERRCVVAGPAMSQRRVSNALEQDRHRVPQPLSPIGDRSNYSASAARIKATDATV